MIGLILHSETLWSLDIRKECAFSNCRVQRIRSTLLAVLFHLFICLLTLILFDLSMHQRDVSKSPVMNMCHFLLVLPLLYCCCHTSMCVYFGNCYILLLNNTQCLCLVVFCALKTNLLFTPIFSCLVCAWDIFPFSFTSNKTLKVLTYCFRYVFCKPR